MTERPIIFSGPMVRAILAGTKTQTRRIAKVNDHDCKPGYITPNAGFAPRRIEDHATYCPYGQPGDRLWVRETFGDCSPGADAVVGTKWDKPWYRADADKYGLLGHDGDGSVYVEDVKWRPSIHMPREASRLTLEITAVRVERLNAISEADARAEGVDWKNCPTVQTQESFYAQRAAHRIGMAAHYVAEIQFRGGFERLWESINGPGSWAANPWVWVVSFRRLP